VYFTAGENVLATRYRQK